MNEQKYKPSETAKKGAMSATVAGGGVGFAYLIVLASRYILKHEMSVDEAFLVAGAITAGIAGAGRGVESAVKWYINIKKEIKE